MTIYIGADHRGFELKELIKKELSGEIIVDMGAVDHNPQDDFVDYAVLVGQKVASDREARGILVCGSGAGMCIASNKIPGIRCSVCHRVEEVKACRQDDNINVLALPSDYVSKGEAVNVVKAFLNTQFTPEERFVRRIAKITELEKHA